MSHGDPGTYVMRNIEEQICRPLAETALANSRSSTFDVI
ncbi:hypothetical protein SFOMI_4796 [Sphingobium fuliginis]|uniref:Uncharacterized protein n=1 Tax=Sphingobium fuliginis (strain ATCC 27551) TaxID=336203 RepID=A0A292ZMS5_SPHSA|nr:hypothetical protein SFOMI_4796 [Sphingobium fuliginis]